MRGRPASRLARDLREPRAVEQRVAVAEYLDLLVPPAQAAALGARRAQGRGAALLPRERTQSRGEGEAGGRRGARGRIRRRVVRGEGEGEGERSRSPSPSPSPSPSRRAARDASPRRLLAAADSRGAPTNAASRRRSERGASSPTRSNSATSRSVRGSAAGASRSKNGARWPPRKKRGSDAARSGVGARRSASAAHSARRWSNRPTGGASSRRGASSSSRGGRSFAAARLARSARYRSGSFSRARRRSSRSATRSSASISASLAARRAAASSRRSSARLCASALRLAHSARSAGRLSLQLASEARNRSRRSRRRRAASFANRLSCFFTARSNTYACVRNSSSSRSCARPRVERMPPIAGGGGRATGSGTRGATARGGSTSATRIRVTQHHVVTSSKAPSATDHTRGPSDARSSRSGSDARVPTRRIRPSRGWSFRPTDIQPLAAHNARTRTACRRDRSPRPWASGAPSPSGRR